MNIPVRTCVAALASISVLAACSSGSNDSPDGDESREFTYWSMWSQGEPMQAVLQEAIADFEADTGITVNVEWQGRDVLTRLQPTLNTSNVPADLVDNGIIGIASTLATSGDAADMSDVLSADLPGEDSTVADVVPQSLIDQSTVDGALVMVPYSTTLRMVYFDGNAFPTLVENPPATYEDFLATLDAQKSDGAPIALDGSISGYNEYYFYHFALNLLGPDGYVDAALDTSGESWRKPEFLQAAQMVEDLVTGGYFIDGYDASQFPAMQTEWAQGNADFLYMGSWAPSETAEYVANGFTYKSFAMPAPAGHETVMSGDWIGFGVPAKSENAEAAEEFVSYFLKGAYQEKLAAETLNIPVRADVPVPPEVEDALAAREQYPLAAVTFDDQYPDWRTKVLWPLDDELTFGTLTAAEFIDELATQTANYWANNG